MGIKFALPKTDGKNKPKNSETERTEWTVNATTTTTTASHTHKAIRWLNGQKKFAIIKRVHMQQNRQFKKHSTANIVDYWINCLCLCAVRIITQCIHILDFFFEVGILSSCKSVSFIVKHAQRERFGILAKNA